MPSYMRHFRIIIISLALSFRANSQTNIQLIIKGGNLITKVYAGDFSFKESLSTDYQDTINFNFTKTNNIDLYNIGCFIKGKQPWNQIWLDSGNIRIYAHMDSTTFNIDTVINSPTYDYVKNFKKNYNNVLKLKDTAQSNKFLFENLNKNINNPFSLWVAMLYLNLNQNNKNNVYDLKQALNKQGNKFSWFRQFADITGRINKILSTDHLILSNFKFIDKQKKVNPLILKNADYYVLDFWFLGCAPCRQEHKIIKRNYEFLLKSKIEVIGISTDEYSKEWVDYLSSNHYYWTNYLQTAKTKLTETLSIKAFPYYVIINSKGVIVGRYNSFSDMLNKFKGEE